MGVKIFLLFRPGRSEQLGMGKEVFLVFKGVIDGKVEVFCTAEVKNFESCFDYCIVMGDIEMNLVKEMGSFLDMVGTTYGIFKKCVRISLLIFNSAC